MGKENRMITKKTLDLLGKHFNLHINDNAEFNEEDHFRILVHAAMQNNLRGGEFCPTQHPEEGTESGCDSIPLQKE